MVTIDEAFGAGINVRGGDAEHPWDIRVDETGDLGTTSGITELFKDLSFHIADPIDDSIGQPLDRRELQQIGRSVESVVRDDARVAELYDETIVERPDYSDRVSVRVFVRTESDTEHELVFPITF